MVSTLCAVMDVLLDTKDHFERYWEGPYLMKSDVTGIVWMKIDQI